MTASSVIDILIHADRYIQILLNEAGMMTYLVAFLVVLCETGLVVTPFLPGDSLLFVLGTLAGNGMMKAEILFPLLFLAALLGDSLNFFIGSTCGSFVERLGGRWVRHEYISATRHFFGRHGRITILIARFVPMLRTFAPFIAGIARVPYRSFLQANAMGCVAWTIVFFGGGFVFGSVPFVQRNIGFVLLSVIPVSLLIGIIAWLNARRRIVISNSAL
jgi:membrane-associated protein